MVGVLTMAAAAAPPPVKDYEIEVRICQVPFCLCLGNCGVRMVEVLRVSGTRKEEHDDPQL